VAALQQAQAETLAAVERHANSQKLELHTVAEQEKAALGAFKQTAPKSHRIFFNAIAGVALNRFRASQF
jgi:hypothetical protein